MQHLFFGSHPAIDFLNTAYAPDGQPMETIGDGRAYLDWFVSAELLERDAATRLLRRLGIKAIDTAAAEGRRVREWARTWLEYWRTQPDVDYAGEIARLNGLLERCVTRPEVIDTEEGLVITEHAHIEDGSALIGLIALQIAQLITQEDAKRVKSCAGPGCTLWFLDRTKAQRRVFCSASTCGNRARVAAFRQRQREG